MNAPKLFYFAYGSNMFSDRLGRRIPVARSLGAARVSGYRIVFHKVGSRDGSGKCGLLRAGPGHVTHGVLFEIPANALTLLDRIEGVGQGYERIELAALQQDSSSLTAVSYLATRLDESLQPFDWYMRHVLAGAREHQLPADYQRRLQAVPTIGDADRVRLTREAALYDD